jgi:hypothetical protein
MMKTEPVSGILCAADSMQNNSLSYGCTPLPETFRLSLVVEGLIYAGPVILVNVSYILPHLE